jgi:dephospho-CoA kinase
VTTGGLGHVGWIGGGSGAGKSTVAAALADRYGLTLHHAEPPSRFLPPTTPAAAPRLHAFAGMSMEERWV